MQSNRIERAKRSYPILEKDDCVDYYYVHFVSYDGGQTWHYDDRETYAGCYYIE